MTSISKPSFQKQWIAVFACSDCLLTPGKYRVSPQSDAKLGVRAKWLSAPVSYRKKWRNSTKKQRNCLRQHERFQIQEESKTPLEEMFPQELENVFKSFFVGIAVRSFALCAKIGSNKWVKNHHFWAQLPHCFTSVEVSRGEYYWPHRLWWIIVLYFTFLSFISRWNQCLHREMSAVFWG